MGIFRQFPYSNFHDMNMDQIIKIMREMQDEWEATKTEWASYKEFIDNYFDNLDVSEEVLNALRIMAADGSLNEIINPVIINETESWIEEHITPTTPIVDASLSITGAAADAGAVGNRAMLSRNVAYTGDVNDLEGNSITVVTRNSTNLPTTGEDYFVVTMKMTTTNIMQIAMCSSGVRRGSLYTRHRVNGTWNAWIMNGINNFNQQFSGNNINDLPINSVYYVARNTTNLPNTNSAFVVITLQSITNAVFQIAYGFSSVELGSFYTRNYSGGAWSNWNGRNITLLINNNAVTNNNDLDTFEKNTIYYVPANTANLPITGSACQVMTLQLVSTSLTQFAIVTSGTNYGKIYRRFFIADAWTEWRSDSGIYPSLPNYMMFGDSIMESYLWLPDPEGHRLELSPFKDWIATRIGNAIGAGSVTVNARSGAKFCGNDNTIYDQIANTDLTNVPIITIGGGRNDSSETLGDKDSPADRDTICGAIKQIINYVRLNYPKTQIVIIQVTPNTNLNADVYTRIYAGGWSLNSYGEKVGELCAEMNVPFVKWNGCSIINSWANFTGTDNNYAHPNTSEVYRQMGNYLGGQVSKYYKA